MSIEDRRNYWNEQVLKDHARWWAKLLLPLACILIVIIACIIFLAGVWIGQQRIIDEACSTGAGRYYLRGTEVCDGR